ncbi:ABC transporter ATP-binding protein [Tengunoibacter tsumagoiensis]|uniref:ABC transporter n=1 Tax=Tengunoibacter tsumagoiensis TaxID=2014871 RepID=A0A401ZW06_9CHLR|nr:ABC transporter ATP-binding protein [Tengunoibacter tsumagoiensis]GCE10950.1 ABC transporter [Tengunoibacter tsumagoiensis]
MLSKREFTVANEYVYRQSNPARWILSHLLRYKYVVIRYIILCIVTESLFISLAAFTGNAFTAVTQGQSALLLQIALIMLGIILILFAADLGARLSIEVLSKRFARDAREELYISLLGKSQTFHNRQRVGDVMARASNDMGQLSDMVSPGFDTIISSSINMSVTFIFIALVNPQLLLVPVLFLVGFLFTIRHYARTLAPISDQMRAQFGRTNAILNEAITGVEVIKGSAQEEQENQKFSQSAELYRDFYVKNGQAQGRYLPTLLLSFALALSFLHALYLLSTHTISFGALITFMGVVVNLRFITAVSIWSVSQIQLGIAGSARILSLLREETEMDQNKAGCQQEIQGEITFDHVTFSYDETPILKDISFTARPGQTVAIVGQTGAGKSTLTKLVNRIYDIQSGRVLIDGVDVREWNLDTLRSQISTIEQDIFLFSRTIAENIGYGLGQKADQQAIEQAARDAQAHEFITRFPQGYETEIGERGVTLSGGQRQRLAIARALLTDPRILILDDSTSAIDSETEDEIQKAIHRVLEGRTTLLITHRLSQIRWADHILVLKRGELIDQGNHEELLVRCETYRRIFSHYDAPVPTAVAHHK